MRTLILFALLFVVLVSAQTNSTFDYEGFKKTFNLTSTINFDYDGFLKTFFPSQISSVKGSESNSFDNDGFIKTFGLGAGSSNPQKAPFDYAGFLKVFGL